MKAKNIIITIFGILFFTIQLNAQWKRIYDYEDSTNTDKDLIINLFVHKNTLFIKKFLRGLWRSTDLGNTLEDITPNIGHDTISAFLSNNDEIIIAAAYSGIYFSTNNGDSWFQKSKTVNGKYIIKLFKYKNRIFVATDSPSIIYYTDNDGETWIKVPKNQDISELYISGFTSIDDKIYIGGVEEVLSSTDGGIDWFNTNEKESPPVSLIFSVGNKLFIGTYHKGLFVSTDEGKTWDFANTGLPHYPTKIAQVVMYNDFIFLTGYTNDWADKGGVFYSKDTGKTWINVTHNIRNRQVSGLALIGDYLFCNILNSNMGSLGGIYRSKIEDLLITDVEDNRVEISKEFYSARPYPNPASNFVRTKIYWNVNYNPLLAEKNIYNIYGQKLNDEKNISIANINNYSAEIIWNCDNVPNGLYFIAIKYFDKLKTIPVIISK